MSEVKSAEEFKAAVDMLQAELDTLRGRDLSVGQGTVLCPTFFLTNTSV